METSELPSNISPPCYTADDPMKYLVELLYDKMKLKENLNIHPRLRNIEKIFQREIEATATYLGLTQQQIKFVDENFRTNRYISRVALGRAQGENSYKPLETTSHGDEGAFPRQIVSMNEKIFISEMSSNNNIVGRILGPLGLTVRRLENETACLIRVQGMGSVKDPVKAARLQGRRGWEHLSEPLHIFVKAQHYDPDECKEKLNKAVKTLRILISGANEQHKKEQLIEYALICGTYEPRTSKMAKNVKKPPTQRKNKT